MHTMGISKQISESILGAFSRLFDTKSRNDILEMTGKSAFMLILCVEKNRKG